MTSTETPDAEAQAPPALFTHCLNVYNAMFEEAKPVNIGTPDKGDEENTEELQVMVYEGFLTQLVTGKLRLATPYYTHTRQALINMGCIRQLRRGGSTTPSQWELIYEPTIEAFESQKEARAPKQSKESFLEERIDALQTEVSELADWRDSVTQFLAEKFGTEEVDNGNDV